MTSAHNSPTAHASVPIPPPTAANANAQLYKCYKDGRPPPSFDQVIDVDREHAEVEELPLLGLGHSLGALMQTLLYCQHAPYTEACAGLALVSWSNQPNLNR